MKVVIVLSTMHLLWKTAAPLTPLYIYLGFLSWLWYNQDNPASK